MNADNIGVDNVQCRDDAPLAQPYFDPCMRGEAFGAAHMAVAVHVDDMLLVRVDAEISETQLVRRGRVQPAERLSLNAHDSTSIV